VVVAITELATATAALTLAGEVIRLARTWRPGRTSRTCRHRVVVVYRTDSTGQHCPRCRNEGPKA
jgi:hypothetical protein